MDTTRRYATLPVRHRLLPDGTTATYRARRLLPREGTAAKLAVLDERLDLVAARELAHALLWWRLVDANRSVTVAELERHRGATIAVPPPVVPVADAGGEHL